MIITLTHKRAYGEQVKVQIRAATIYTSFICYIVYDIEVMHDAQHSRRKLCFMMKIPFERKYFHKTGWYYVLGRTDFHHGHLSCSFID